MAAVFLCIIEALSLLCCLLILLILLYNILYQKKHKIAAATSTQPAREISTSIIILSLFAVLFYILALISLLIGDSLIDSIYFIGFPYGAMSITWATANCFVYLTFMRRLHNIFNDTIYECSKYTYTVLSILIFIYWLCEFSFFLF
eukprot:477795_1